MNKVFLIGNLTRAPELRESTAGYPVCNFTLAVNKRSSSDHPEADYFRVTVWRDLAKRCAQYLDKGKKACVIGTVSATAYIAKDGTARANLEVTADSVEFLTPRQQTGAAQETDGSGYVRVNDEELPFP